MTSELVNLGSNSNSVVVKYRKRSLGGGPRISEDNRIAEQQTKYNIMIWLKDSFNHICQPIYNSWLILKIKNLNEKFLGYLQESFHNLNEFLKLQLSPCGASALRREPLEENKMEIISTMKGTGL